jgi:hypothetical protein
LAIAIADNIAPREVIGTKNETSVFNARAQRIGYAA